MHALCLLYVLNCEGFRYFSVLWTHLVKDGAVAVEQRSIADV